jgi:hypothetical protein
MDPVPVDYASPQCPSRGKWWARAAAIALAATVLAASWRFGGPVAGQVKYLRGQQRCAGHALSAGTVVYEEDPTAARLLLAGTPDYRGPSQLLLNFPGGKPAAGWSPPAFYAPPALAGINYSMPPAYSGVAFLHRRRSAAGAERLVVAEVGTGGFGDPVLGHAVQILVRVWDWGTWRVGSRLTQVGGPTSVHLKLAPGAPPLQLRAGAADECDPSHFVIDYSIGDDKSGHIDGWLRDAGQTPWRDEPSSRCEFVELSVRDGPLKPADAGRRYASYEFPVTRPRVPAWRRERDGLNADGTPVREER